MDPAPLRNSLADVRPVIRVERATVLVPGPDASSPRAILQDLDAEFSAGERHLVLGPNGSGKTTLLRLLAGLLHPSSGRVVWEGPLDPSPGEAATGSGVGESSRWPGVAVVFEEPDPQFLAETVEGEIAFGLESMELPAAEIRARVDEAVEAFDLAGLRARAPHTLSGGEKARVLLAAMSAARPHALLLDQSLAHLDPGARRLLERRILDDARREGRTVIRAHQDAEAPEPDERIRILSQGRLLDAARLSPREVLEAADVPWPLAMRISALLAGHGRWSGPLARSVASLVEGLASRADQAAPVSLPGSAEVPAAPPLGDAVAAFRGVSFSPAGGGRRDSIVSGIDLELRAGSVTALVGASGAGKTTILKLAAGLLEPTEGTIERAPGFHGTRPAALALEYPERQLFGRSVNEDVAAALWIRGVSPGERDARAHDALRAVGLDPDRFGARVPATLSEGEKRRVGIAALLAEPARLLIFDEPTAGLDPAGRRAVAGTIQRLRERGHAVLVASHDLDFVSGAADRIMVLGREAGGPGRILGQGRAPDLWRCHALLSRAGLPPPDVAALAHAMAGFGWTGLEHVTHAESLLDALSIDLGPAVMDTQPR
ncbi:MAG: ABC transporter ATP-binding protein [Candidatus Eiseniibacteriota bacterium]